MPVHNRPLGKPATSPPRDVHTNHLMRLNLIWSGKAWNFVSKISKCEVGKSSRTAAGAINPSSSVDGLRSLDIALQPFRGTWRPRLLEEHRCSSDAVDERIQYADHSEGASRPESRRTVHRVNHWVGTRDHVSARGAATAWACARAQPRVPTAFRGPG